MFKHPALDYTNTYGVRPFLPFDGTWYYGDLLYIFDPYIDAILLLGLVAGTVFNRNRKIMAWVSVILALGYIGARFELGSLAASHMEGYAAQAPTADEWSVLPTMLNPFVWEGVVRTQTEWIKLNVDAIGGVTGEVARIERGHPPILCGAPLKQRALRHLTDSRASNAVHVEGMEFGYRVLFIDFRFYNEVDKTALGAEILLDRSTHITGESLSFAQSVK
jgi:hypothetical protein